MCAAWVVSRMFPDADFVPAAYGDQNLITTVTQDCYENANINDRYIIVDFSFPRPLMELIANKVESIVVLDHHKTAEENCKGLPYCHFDMNESGASMAWKHYFPNEPLPHLVKYIKDRDLWKFQEPYSREVNAFIQSYPMEIDTYDMLNEMFIARGWQPAYEGGQSIERYKDIMVDAICRTAAFTDNYPFYDRRIPIVNTSSLFSEVGHALCRKFPNAPYAAYYYDRLKDDVRQWGLRSVGNNPENDVSAIAKKFGGGGHFNAAGFEQRLSEL